jgi:Zn finger protein HypA/HybF involved in hydrogenase expression
MRLVGHRLDEDAYLDALQDAAHERFLEVAVRCAECGAVYDQGYHPATRLEPAWAECEECPNCGSGAIEATTGDGVG